ncbi:hypothetical protein [Streptomyces sp. enrichment culture]|uniref:hypothetical protein n=1 Tax=Streptomyces sp. enrichment culture TaxID=1795815 RepID=UPI003F55959E
MSYFEFLPERSDDFHLMYETRDGSISGPYCPHVEVTGTDLALYPDGASCLPCARGTDFDPEGFETAAEHRARTGRQPLPSPSWSAANDDPEPHPEWTCQHCGKPLPDESSVRREFCSSRCRSAAHRARRRD